MTTPRNLPTYDFTPPPSDYSPHTTFELLPVRVASIAADILAVPTILMFTLAVVLVVLTAAALTPEVTR